MTGEALTVSALEQDRRITILEENAKRFDRDLQAVKQEMNDGFRQINGSVKELGGKLDSINLLIATKAGQVEGGWWAATKIAAVTSGLITVVLLLYKHFAG